MGNLLAQQLVAAGERVLDVPPKLAARVAARFRTDQPRSAAHPGGVSATQLLCELVPGGVRKQLRTSQASVIVEGIVADSPIGQAKLELARDLVPFVLDPNGRDDLRFMVANVLNEKSDSSLRVDDDGFFVCGDTWASGCW